MLLSVTIQILDVVEYYTVLKKTSHLYNLLEFLHTQLDCDNFWAQMLPRK